MSGGGDAGPLVRGVLAGDRGALARAITLVESGRPAHRRLADRVLEALPPPGEDSLRVGVSGPAGAGKSTLVGTLGAALVSRGRRVAVLAVDPSSPVGGGSVLGDRVRMGRLSGMEGAFIRPSPSGGAPGGLSPRTREAVLLCEAAGFGVVLVETAGAGQGEWGVGALVDCLVLLVPPHGGDEVQLVKKGALELADVLVVGRADGDLAPEARRMAGLIEARGLPPHPDKPFWRPRAQARSALAEEDALAVWEDVEAFVRASRKDGHFLRKRAAGRLSWMGEAMDRLASEWFRRESAAAAGEWESRVAAGDASPPAAARAVVSAVLAGRSNLGLAPKKPTPTK